MIKLNENQQRAVDTIDKNVLVKAGAGAGKTAVLTERFVKLVKNANSKSEKEKILAITFTNKAVEEMKSRVIKKFMEENIPLDFNINIYTFDSFFKRVVDKYDSEKYIGFSMIEEFETEDVLKQIVTDIYENTDYKNTIDTIQMLNDSYDIETSLDEIVQLYNRTRNIYGNINFKELKSPGKKQLFMTIGKIIELSREYYKRKNKLWDLLEERFYDRDENDLLTLEELILIAEAVSKDEITIEIQNSSIIIDFLYEELYSDLKDMMDLIDYRYNKIKKDNFLFDFTDITLDAIRCMIQNLDEMKEEYNYIMIDEFQDTSPLQMKFFKILTDDYSINNIFVVGDVKQSIYRFRGADYKNIIKFEADIAEKDGEVIELNTNYRSEPQLISFTNEAFKNILSNYSDMIPGLDEDLKNTIYNINIDDDINENICNVIFQLIEEGYDYKDIGILSTKKKNNANIIKTLNKYNIPYVNHNPQPMFERPEAKELLIILNLMLEEDNKLYLLSALRGLLFNLSDKSIGEIIEDGAFFEYEGNNDEIINAKELYNDLKIKFSNMEISNFLSYLYEDLEFFSKCNSIWGIESANNLLLLKNYLTNVVEEEQKSLKYAIIRLQRDKMIESVNLYSKNENAISLSTIHKSKGLEYKIVILTDLAEVRRNIVPKFIIDDMTLYAKIQNNIGAYHIASRKEKFELKEEDDRLLYVALTRAKEKLIIDTKEKITPTMMLSSIADVFDKNKVDIEIIDHPDKVESTTLKSNFINNTQIGTPVNTVNPFETSLNIIADTSFGDFIHHFAEMYETNNEIDLNKLIDLYKVDEIYDYEKIKRHIDNVSSFIDSREGKIFVEKNILLPGNYDINAVIDRLEIVGDDINIIDYKTVEIDNNIVKYNDIYRSQLLLYKDIISKMYGDKNIKSFIFYTSIGRLEEILWCTKF